MYFEELQLSPATGEVQNPDRCLATTRTACHGRAFEKYLSRNLAANSAGARQWLSPAPIVTGLPQAVSCGSKPPSGRHYASRAPMATKRCRRCFFNNYKAIGRQRKADSIFKKNRARTPARTAQPPAEAAGVRGGESVRMTPAAVKNGQ